MHPNDPENKNITVYNGRKEQVMNKNPVLRIFLIYGCYKKDAQNIYQINGHDAKDAEKKCVFQIALEGNDKCQK